MPQQSNAQSTSSHRVTKKLKTRRSIEDHATRMVLDRGMNNVTVEEIAEAAGISPRTFFNYFSTKEEAIIGATPAQPTDGEIEEFLEIHVADENLMRKSIDFFIHLLTKNKEMDWEIQQRRRQIKAAEPELRSMMLMRFHQTSQDFERLIERYLTAHPTKSVTGLGARIESRMIVSIAALAITSAISTWEQDKSGAQDDIFTYAHEALASISSLSDIS